MLGNLFENAVHAASKSKDGFLSFSCKIEDGSLLIELTNSSPETAEFHNGLPVSHRPGGGTGTRSIKTTVQKYNGILSFSQSGNTFIARIIIPMHA
jgi:sensor histidine kinase regulating citrate/malate metabolism